MTDRLYIAEQVDKRIDYLNMDATQLELLLRDETLSSGARERVLLVIQRLQRVADKARPQKRREAA